MKAKKIIERIVKIMNMMMNMMMAYMAVACYCNYGVSGYIYSDTVMRIPWIIGMFVVFNCADYLIRKMIREF